MIRIVNDLHGYFGFFAKTIEAVKKMCEGDTLIINGDGAGSRGPWRNKLTKLFYEVRRGEKDYRELVEAITATDGAIDIPREWVFESVHGGVFTKLLCQKSPVINEIVEREIQETLSERLVPLAKVAADNNVKIIYLPGNGEIVPNDFDVRDIRNELTVHPNERYYHELYKKGFFRDLGIDYIPYCSYDEKQQILMLSINILDVSIGKALDIIREKVVSEIKTILVHYPPAISPLGSVFDFWNPNQVDVKRVYALQAILQRLQLKDAKIYFGHIHLGPNDSRMDRYPELMSFRNQTYEFDWVKPGAIISI